LFAFYEYDDPIPVEGNIHVGLVQANEVGLNFGLDKNTNSNVGQLHYSLGLGGSWINSEINGSVMIRPVLRANKTEAWSDVLENESSVRFRPPSLPQPCKWRCLSNSNTCGMFMAALEHGGPSFAVRSMAQRRCL